MAIVGTGHIIILTMTQAVRIKVAEWELNP